MRHQSTPKALRGGAIVLLAGLLSLINLFALSSTAQAEVTLTPAFNESISIYVQKIWDDDVAEDERGPVEFELYRNGSATGVILTLDGTEDTGYTLGSGQYEFQSWIGVFDGLDPIDNESGVTNTYTVKEITTDSSWELTETQGIAMDGGVTRMVTFSYTADATAISNGIYAATIGDGGDTVVYCLDPTRSWPDSSDPYEVKIINATNENLLGLSNGATSSTLKDDLLSVIYNGYPNDNAGIQDAYGLSDAEFQEVTQVAIWRYSYPSVWATHIPSFFTTDMEQALYALIGESNTQNISPVAVPDGIGLTAYENTNDEYQGLLSSSLVSTIDLWQITNGPANDVAFSKVDPDGNGLSGAVIQVLSSDGSVIDTWTSDGSAHSVPLAEGTYVFHEESSPSGYVAVSDITFTVSSDGTVTVTDANGGTVVASGSTLTVTDQASAGQDQTDQDSGSEGSDDQASDDETSDDQSSASVVPGTPSTGDPTFVPNASLMALVGVCVVGLAAYRHRHGRER